MSTDMHVTCTEQTTEAGLPDFLIRAFDRIENFWSGHPSAPAIRRDLFVISSEVANCFYSNFKPQDKVYIQAKFFLSNGRIEITLFPYASPSSYPIFEKPFQAYYGEYTK